MFRFMLAGAVGMLLGLVLFSNSGNIAGVLGDPLASDGSGSRTGLVIAIVAFWIVDGFTNTLQVWKSSPFLHVDSLFVHALLSLGRKKTSDIMPHSVHFRSYVRAFLPGSIGPVSFASGRCCTFRSSGHGQCLLCRRERTRENNWLRSRGVYLKN